MPKRPKRHSPQAPKWHSLGTLQLVLEGFRIHLVDEVPDKMVNTNHTLAQCGNDGEHAKVDVKRLLQLENQSNVPGTSNR